MSYYNACQVSPCDMETSQNNATDTSTPCDNNDSVVQPPKHRVALSDITSCTDIDALTIRQLKVLLVNNYVDFKGCCEKQELVERVQELWADHKKLIQTGKWATPCGLWTTRQQTNLTTLS